MTERGIAEELVEKTIRDPDILEFSRHDPGRYVAIRRHVSFQNKQHVLIVIYEVQNQGLLVITLIDTSKVDKYTS